jgi:7tm Odorant receptor
MGNLISILRSKMRKTFEKSFQLRDFFKCETFFAWIGRPLFKDFTISERALKFRKYLTNSTVTVTITASLQMGLSFIASQKSYVQSIELLGHCGIIVLVICKMFYFIYGHQGEISDIIESLRENFPTMDQTRGIVANHMKVYVKFCIVTLIVYAFVHVMALGEVLVSLIKYQWDQSSSTPILYSKLYYPFDPFQSMFVYGFLFIYESWISFSVTIIMFSIDILIASIFTVSTMEFEVLGENLKKVADFEELTRLIEIHQKLLTVAGKLKDIFAPVMLVDIFCLIWALCCLGFIVFTGVSCDTNVISQFITNNILGYRYE